MKLSAVDRRQILITVKTVNMQRKLYLENVRCKVYFFDQSKNQVGDQLFNFTDRKTPTLSAGESIANNFPLYMIRHKSGVTTCSTRSIDSVEKATKENRRNS